MEADLLAAGEGVGRFAFRFGAGVGVQRGEGLRAVPVQQRVVLRGGHSVHVMAPACRVGAVNHSTNRTENCYELCSVRVSRRYMVD